MRGLIIKFYIDNYFLVLWFAKHFLGCYHKVRCYKGMLGIPHFQILRYQPQPERYQILSRRSRPVRPRNSSKWSKIRENLELKRNLLENCSERKDGNIHYTPLLLYSKRINLSMTMRNQMVRSRTALSLFPSWYPPSSFLSSRMLYLYIEHIRILFSSQKLGTNDAFKFYLLFNFKSFKPS